PVVRDVPAYPPDMTEDMGLRRITDKRLGQGLAHVLFEELARYQVRGDSFGLGSDNGFPPVRQDYGERRCVKFAHRKPGYLCQVDFFASDLRAPFTSKEPLVAEFLEFVETHPKGFEFFRQGTDHDFHAFRKERRYDGHWGGTVPYRDTLLISLIPFSLGMVV